MFHNKFSKNISLKAVSETYFRETFIDGIFIIQRSTLFKCYLTD